MVAGYLERDIHYTEPKEGGEEVVVTIPWENTHLYATPPNRVNPTRPTRGKLYRGLG